jgi:hypothetical protein
MTETKKINLSAMMKHANKEEVKTEVTWENIPINNKLVEKKANIEKEVEDTITSPIKISDIQKSPPNTAEHKVENTIKLKTSNKISLSTIKAVKEKKAVVTAPVKKKIIKDEKTLYYESLTSKVLSNDEKKSKISMLKTPLKSENKDSIKKPTLQSKILLKKESLKNQEIEMTPVIDDKEIKKVEISCEIAKKEEYIKSHSKTEPDNLDVFSNYESDYKKKETTILGAVKELTKIANLKKLTKTNKVFVWWIIAATVFWISFLFYVDPEIHSIENYKTSILSLAGKTMTQQEMNTHQTEIINDIAWKLNQNNLGWYQLDFEILVNELWNAVYKFAWNEYKDKRELDTAIKEKLTELKLDKIRNYLKNK